MIYCDWLGTLILCPGFFRLMKRGARSNLPASLQERTQSQTEKGRGKKSKFQANRSINSIVFFDQHCPLCRRTITYLAQQDQKKHFRFAPLDGTTAEKMFLNRSHLLNLNTVILVEQPGGKIWLRGRAVFRVLWLLGGKWKFLGWLYKMPFVDLFYKFIAKHRKRGGDLPPLSVHLLP